MVNIQTANAMAEVLHYLKGINKEDVDKIPQKFLDFLEENASKEYSCDFDYNKELNELKLLNETRGIIGAICYKYWCETDEQKKIYLNKLKDNERKFQEEFNKKYNSNYLFINKKTDKFEVVKDENEQNVALVEYKESIFVKLKNWFKNLFFNK